MAKPTIKEIDISELKQDPNNARKRTALSSKVIARSLEEFGACRSAVADEDGVVRAGNGTLEKAIEAGIKKALVVETDGKTLVVVKRPGLTEEQWRQYAIADNTASDFSAWDTDILSDLASEIDLSEFFPDDELQKVLMQKAVESFDSDGWEKSGDLAPETSTKEIDPNSFEFECTCPKCGFQFNQ
jgi:hypothetical protein